MGGNQVKKLIICVILLLLPACGPEFECQTAFGIKVVNADPLTCGDIQAVEIMALREFTQVTDPRFTSKKIRQSFYGYKLEIRNPPEFTVDGQVTTGYTSCKEGWIAVGFTDRKSALGTFAHELAHVVQHCDPNLPMDTKTFWATPMHGNWHSSGIDAALERIGDQLQ